MLHLSFGRRLILVVSVVVTAIAVFAFALTPALSDDVRPMLQSLGIISCSSSGPCQEGKNASTGPGLEGISAKGSGVIGQTTSSGSHAGVLGQDKSTSPNEAGVKGTSTNGAGVIGQSTNGTGMISASTTSDGLVSRTFRNSTQTFSGASGVFGGDGSSDGGHLNAGVTGSSFNGIGVEGTADNWVGVNAVGGFSDPNTGDSFPALSIVGNGNALIDACLSGSANPCDGHNYVFSVRSDGSVDTETLLVAHGLTSSGNITSFADFDVDGTGVYRQNNICVAGCPAATATSAGRAVATYASMTSQPTLEDFGEAQLVNGQSYVHLDRKFANVIDQQETYLVFITPEGDANVLYVTQKSESGFTVRESHGGRSTITFDYRIAAKPFGSHEARLPMVEVPKLHRHNRST